MKKTVFILIFCLALILASCGKKPSAAKLETIEGVTYIHNPETPLHPDKTVSFEQELAIGKFDESKEIPLYKPSRYMVDTTGKIYISDESDKAIKVFDQNGTFLKSIGRRGDGPGEFNSIGYMAILPNGNILVMDFQSRRTSLFKPDGEFINSYPWRTNISRIYLATDSSYTVNESIYKEEASELWVKMFDFLGNELVSFGKFSSPEFKRITQRGTQGNIMVSMMPVPQSPSSKFAGDQERQWLYHCLNNKYLIEVYDQNGKLFRKIDRPYEPVPFTSEDAKKFLSRFEARPDSPAAKLAKQIELPKVKTVAERLLVDDQGNLWLETNEEKKEGEKTLRAYDIFNKDGFYDARVWCEFPPDLFIAGKMYRLAEDKETGMNTVNRYRVVWSKE
jgi:hypothetical protein